MVFILVNWLLGDKANVCAMLGVEVTILVVYHSDRYIHVHECWWAVTWIATIVWGWGSVCLQIAVKVVPLKSAGLWYVHHLYV